MAVTVVMVAVVVVARAALVAREVVVAGQLVRMGLVGSAAVPVEAGPAIMAIRQEVRTARNLTRPMGPVVAGPAAAAGLAIMPEIMGPVGVAARVEREREAAQLAGMAVRA